MRALTYTRWWCLQEMARGRMLAVPENRNDWRLANKSPFLFGLGEPLELVPEHTARAMVAKHEVSPTNLQFPADLMHLHDPYRITMVGRERVASRPAWSLKFTDWLVGKYGPGWVTKWDGVEGVSLCRSPLQGVRPALPGPVQQSTKSPWYLPPGQEPGQPGHLLQRY